MIGIPLCDGSGKRVGTVCKSEFTVRRRILYCPICERRTRHVIQDEGAESYYSPIIRCVRCGDMWSDGELLQRPFRRGWRQERIARAKQLWAEAS